MKYTITLEYQGKQYNLLDDDKDYPEWNNACDGVIYMYTEGNYGCDCNRSSFIVDQCDEDFPEMECGDTITLISIRDQAGRIVWPERSESPVYVQRPSGLYMPQGETS